LGLILVHGESCRSIFCLLHVNSQFVCLLKRWSFLNICFWYFCWKTSVAVWTYFCVFCYIPLVYVYIFVPRPCYFCYYGSEYNMKWATMLPVALLLYSGLSIMVFFCFLLNFRILFFSISVKNVVGILTVTALNH
jgi:hypothetical protein